MDKELTGFGVHHDNMEPCYHFCAKLKRNVFAAEAAALEQEADMPLEDLLKMYGYKNPGDEGGEGGEDAEGDKEAEEAAKDKEEQKVSCFFL